MVYSSKAMKRTRRSAVCTESQRLVEAGVTPTVYSSPRSCSPEFFRAFRLLR